MTERTDHSNVERIFARMCRDEAYAEQIRRGEFGTSELSEDERTALQHDAGLLLAETVGFTRSFLVDGMGISAGWIKPSSSYLHGSDFNAAKSHDAHHPQP